MEEKIIRAWGIVGEHGLTWGDVEPSNGDYGAALSLPNISTNKKYLKDWDLEDGEKIVRIIIHY